MVLRNRGPNMLLLVSMTADGIGSRVTILSRTTSEVFEAFVEQILAPTLKEGQIVVMDNVQGYLFALRTVCCLVP
jgi:hypothetical protein